MKPRLLLLLFFLAGAPAQSTPREHYDSICPNQNDQIVEIRQGYFVKYRCNYLGSHGGPTMDAMYSPEECAERCRTASTCSGSTWNYSTKQCVLSGAGRARLLSGALFMEVVDASSIPPQPTDPPIPTPEHTTPGQPENSDPCLCTSGLVTGTCYVFKSDTGSRVIFDGNRYTEAPSGSRSSSGKFQLCRDEQCQPGLTVDPNHRVYIRHVDGAMHQEQVVIQWLDHKNGGQSIGQTGSFTEAGSFSITKWPCGKYCLTGSADGLQLAGPNGLGLVFDASKPESCVELSLLEVPCSIRDSSNNCMWKSTRDKCCGQVDCGGRAVDEEVAPIVTEPEEPLPYCPSQDGTMRTLNGVTFEVMCSAAYSTTIRQVQEGISDPDTCVQACAADPGCQGANWKFSTSQCIKHYVYTGQPSGVNNLEDWVCFRPTLER